MPDRTETHMDSDGNTIVNVSTTDGATGKLTKRVHTVTPRGAARFKTRTTEKFDDDGDTIVEEVFEKDVTFDAAGQQTGGSRDTYYWAQPVGPNGRELTKRLLQITFSVWRSGQYRDESVEMITDWYPDSGIPKAGTLAPILPGGASGPANPIDPYHDDPSKRTR
jgi:hypothetical protein